MKVEYVLSSRTVAGSRTKTVTPEEVVRSRPPRVTCLLALAHHFEELVRSGDVKDYADLARLGRVSRARISGLPT